MRAAILAGMKTPLPALVLSLALASGLTACRTTSTDGPCEYGFVTQMYLGRAIPGGGAVDDAAFAQFLDEVVTPRFPGGYTVLDSQSRWRAAGGASAATTAATTTAATTAEATAATAPASNSERSAILQIVHCESSTADTALKEIAAAYAERFQQQEILRTDSRTRIWW